MRIINANNLCGLLHKSDLDNKVALYNSKRRITTNSNEKKKCKSNKRKKRNACQESKVSTVIEGMSIDVIDTKIMSFRLESGFNTELVVFDSKAKMDYVNCKEPLVESPIHGDQIGIAELRLINEKSEDITQRLLAQ